MMRQTTLFQEDDDPDELNDSLTVVWRFKTNGTGRYWGRAFWKTRAGVCYIDKIWLGSKKNPLRFMINLLVTHYHEYLHLFLKFRLNERAYSEVTVIEPLAKQLVKEIIKLGEINSWASLLSEDLGDFWAKDRTVEGEL